eukprot:SAG22_NODE_4511_length_1247_cov_2.299652_2_plen_22_part_01
MPADTNSLCATVGVYTRIKLYG